MICYKLTRLKIIMIYERNKKYALFGNRHKDPPILDKCNSPFFWIIRYWPYFVNQYLCYLCHYYSYLVHGGLNWYERQDGVIVMNMNPYDLISVKTRQSLLVLCAHITLRTSANMETNIFSQLFISFLRKQSLSWIFWLLQAFQPFQLLLLLRPRFFPIFALPLCWLKETWRINFKGNY